MSSAAPELNGAEHDQFREFGRERDAAAVNLQDLQPPRQIGISDRRRRRRPGAARAYR